ncbi:MAG: thioredoxin domain-containing protein [Kofleriaceae bacterium]|nr:thioredoxin domain-containing protein [Kofleriaceae bacterium]
MRFNSQDWASTSKLSKDRFGIAPAGGSSYSRVMLSWQLAACICSLSVALVSQEANAAPEETGDTVSSEQRFGGHLQIIESRPTASQPSLGPASAPVTIEFFISLNNPRTGRALQTIRELAARHPTRLQVIFRLTEKREFGSNLAQSFGMEAWTQGRFFPFLDAFYEGRGRPPASKEFADVAAKAGVDYTRVRAAMEASLHRNKLSRNHNRWRRMAVRQLPGLVINGHPIAMGNLSALEKNYDEAYAQSMALLAKGVPKNGLQKELRRISLEKIQSQSRKMRGHVGSLDLAPDEELPTGPVPVAMKALLGGTHRKGPDDASIKAVFLCHLRSSMCRTMFGYLDDLGRLYPNDFQLIYLPLFFPDRPGQENAAEMYEAVLCADEQKSYWEYITTVYEQRIRVNFDRTYALEIASTLNLDAQRFEQCLTTGRQQSRLQAELQLARSSGARHTPALAIGGLLYSGRLYANDLRNLVESLYQPGVLNWLSSP